MDAQIQRLVHLQVLDARLAALRNRLQAIPGQLAAADARVSIARQQIATAKEALTSSLKDRKTYEMDVDSWKEKARKYRDQSFAVKTNEAYKALQHEIQHAETQVAQAEDRLLERMVSGEEYERQVKAAERSVIVSIAKRKPNGRTFRRNKLRCNKSCKPRKRSAARSPQRFPRNSLARTRR